jgi:FSR family fosmidomycin resistance protein-like MFS transporter
MRVKNIGILSLGHVAVDINQGALPAMLPFFIAEYGLSYTAAAAIVFAVNVSSSVVQPLFGLAADKFSKPWFLPAGLLMAGGGLGLAGLFSDYLSILLLCVISGIGIAAYHPEAARLVNFSSGQKKGTAMSLFGVGGILGFTLGPILAGLSLDKWGLSGSMILIVPVCIMSLVMMSQMKNFAALGAAGNARLRNQSGELGEDNWPAFYKIAGIVSMRSIIFFGLNTFIPLYWISELHQSKLAGAAALTVFAGSGVLGNLVGGRLSDKIGLKKVMILGFAGLTLLLPVLPLIENVSLATSLLFLIGFIQFLTFSPAIVLGQSYLPNRVGLSSGVTIGLSVAVGGGFAPVLGMIADTYNVWTALVSLCCFPIFLLLLSLSLPEPEQALS